ncbi:hypothetical protein R1flu_022535 [Riccia fluitans]|uniref:FCP1 homology domain-containing protein n=1 Tax=Riccia fluitans TaxID=41844 RepID=A0ABD1XTJ4_9MARC
MKTLILDLNRVLLYISRTSDDFAIAPDRFGYAVYTTSSCQYVIARIGLREFLDACLAEFQVIIWTSKTATSTRTILDCLEKKQVIPSGMASG